MTGGGHIFRRERMTRVFSRFHQSTRLDIDFRTLFEITPPTKRIAAHITPSPHPFHTFYCHRQHVRHVQLVRR